MPDPTVIEGWRRDYAAGATITEIAARARASRQTVLRELRDITRPRGPRPLPVSVAQVVAAVQECGSRRKAAQALGVSQQLVRARLAEAGLVSPRLDRGRAARVLTEDPGRDALVNDRHAEAQAKQMLAASLKAASGGRALIEESISLRRQALDLLPPGTILEFVFPAQSPGEYHVIRQDDRSWAHAGQRVDDGWVDEEWSRGNLRIRGPA